jgi:hypothetical protein
MYVNLKKVECEFVAGIAGFSGSANQLSPNVETRDASFRSCYTLRVHLESCWRMFYHNNILNFSLGSVFRELLEVLS